jgi:hypothetical protein
VARQGRKGADEALLVALACGATVDSAARASGLAPRTVHRRLKDPEFQNRLQAMRGDMVERSTAMLTAAGMESVKTLVTLQHPTIPPAVRLGAARAVLEIGMRQREVSELTQRIAVLEAQVNRAGCQPV